MPTTAESGLEAGLSRHFGRAPYFTVVEAETGAARVLANPAVAHDHGCAPTELLAGEGVGAVICQQLGRGALARLRELGVRVYLTEAEDVRSALAVWQAGGLAEAEAGQLNRGRIHDCGHHHHGHGQDHGH